VDIGRQGKQIISLVHNQALESSLKQMAVATVSLVEINRVGCEEPPHQFGEGRVPPAFQKKVKMVGQKAESMNAKVKKTRIFPKVMKKLPIIPRAFEGKLP
jgi:hypothetical protein